MNQKKTAWKINGKDLFFIVLGSALTAFASKCIYDPNQLVIGGVSGLAILIKWFGGRWWGIQIPLWLTTFAFNLPLMLAAWHLRGFGFIYRVALATAIYTLWLAVLPKQAAVKGDLLLAAVFGALLSGAGVGLVFRAKASTGGTDTAATLVWPYFRQYSLIQVLQAMDGCIVALGVFAFGIRQTLYAVIAVYVAARVSDGLLEGVKFAKQALIVTDRAKEMAEEVMEKLERGMTGLRAVGMYSQSDKMMLYCVVNKKEILTLKEIVGQVDKKAFLVVSDAREVLGEGFLTGEF